MEKPDQAAEQLFEAAFELSAEERRVFLDRSCSSRPALRRRVEALLEAGQRRALQPLHHVGAGVQDVPVDLQADVLALEAGQLGVGPTADAFALQRLCASRLCPRLIGDPARPPRRFSTQHWSSSNGTAFAG